MPALLLRALIPQGCMPGAAGMVPCDGYAPVPPAAAATMADMPGMHDMPGMDMAAADPGAMDTGERAQASQGHAPASSGHAERCPFAASAAGLATPAATSAAPWAFAGGSVPLPLPDGPVHAPAIVRAQAARAPPAGA